MSLLERLDAVGLDIPRQDLLVDVREKDAARELGHVGILFEEGLRVEDDRLLQVARREISAPIERRSSCSISSSDSRRA